MRKSELTYVIEDDPITATLHKLLLEKHLPGGRVQAYANGQRALDQILAAFRDGTDDVPDLILLDLNMPMMDGWEFLDALLPLGHTVCVLVLTSSINAEDRARASRYQNVAGYFAKPLDLSGMQRMLQLRRKANGPQSAMPSSTGAPLHHIVYQSVATTPLNEPELTQLLTQSRAFNAAHGLTGILLHSHGGNFVQLLEGPEPTLHTLFARIARDPRHATVVKLANGPVAQRQFGQWSMGFRTINPTEFARFTGYFDPTQDSYLADTPLLPDPDLHALLATFVADDGMVM